MERETDLSGPLAAKLACLETISALTKTLVRFARQQKTKGLLRVLAKRGQALAELVAINDALARAGLAERRATPGLSPLVAQIAALERKIVADNQELTHAAHLAYQAIKAGMRGLQEHRKMRSAYDLQGITWAGRRINCCK